MTMRLMIATSAEMWTAPPAKDVAKAFLAAVVAFEFGPDFCRVLACLTGVPDGVDVGIIALLAAVKQSAS